MTTDQQIQDLRETLRAAIADVKATTAENITLKAQLHATPKMALAWTAYLSTLNTQLSTKQ